MFWRRVSRVALCVLSFTLGCEESSTPETSARTGDESVPETPAPAAAQATGARAAGVPRTGDYIEFSVPGVGMEWEFGSLRIAVEQVEAGKTTLMPALIFEKAAALTQESVAGFPVLAATPDLSGDHITATLEMISAPLEGKTSVQMEVLNAAKEMAQALNTPLPNDVPWAVYRERIADQIVPTSTPENEPGVREYPAIPYQKVSYLSDAVNAYNQSVSERYQLRLQPTPPGYKFVILVQSLKGATKDSGTQVNFGLRVGPYAGGTLSWLSGYVAKRDTNYLYSRLTNRGGCSVADGFTAHISDPNETPRYPASMLLLLLQSDLVESMFIDIILSTYALTVAKADENLVGFRLKNKLQFMPKIRPSQFYSELPTGAGSVGAAVNAIPNLQELTCRYLEFVTGDAENIPEAVDRTPLDTFTYANCMTVVTGATSTASFIQHQAAVTSTNVPIFSISGQPAMVIEERFGGLQRGFLIHGTKQGGGLSIWELDDHAEEFVDDALEEICQINFLTWNDGTCEPD